MNTKICTSIEQSKKLIELGIDVNTADIIYNIFDESYIRHNTPIDKYHLPAWSLSTLLDMIPPYLGKYNDGIDFGFSKSINGKWYSAHYIQFGDSLDKINKIKVVTGDTAVDAVYEMVVWLKENRKI